MKGYKILLLSMAAIAVVSCRPMGDDLLSYGQADAQSFSLIDKSYAEQFKALWAAMNENYCMWDVEEVDGFDWDKVYDQYLPIFEAMDDTVNKMVVPDTMLTRVYNEIIDPLHDGHLAITIKNPQTKKNVTVSPGANRVMRERKDEFMKESYTILNLDQYVAGQVSGYEVLDFDRVSSTSVVGELMDSTLTKLTAGASAYIALVDATGGPNPTNNAIYAQAQTIVPTATQQLASIKTIPLMPKLMLTLMLPALVKQYNELCMQYGAVALQFGVEMEAISQTLAGDAMGLIEYALFKGNIAYLRLGGFGLSAHMARDLIPPTDTSALYKAYQAAACRVWHNWFDTIQTLHANSSLGGVILDFRNNGGGYVNDYRFLVGALLPSGDWQSHMMRVKNGSGRYDFAPMMPFMMPTYKGEHAIINKEPIIALCNTNSVSMAEVSTWGVKCQPNGIVVGMRTFGGLSALSPDPKNYSDTYSGAFGVENVTSIYGYVPKYVSFFPDEQGNLRTLEGVGVTPDIELPLDSKMWASQLRDNQLERAIDEARAH